LGLFAWQYFKVEEGPKPIKEQEQPTNKYAQDIVWWDNAALNELHECITAEASCVKSIMEKYGADNDPAEVTKLQLFLNEFMAAGLTVNGIYDEATLNAVNQFQVAYKEQVLKPWVEAQMHDDENDPTGYVYKTTKRWINLLKCPSLNIPMPDFLEDWLAYSSGTGEVLGEETGTEGTDGTETNGEETQPGEETLTAEEQGTTKETAGQTQGGIAWWIWLIIALVLIAAYIFWTSRKK